MRRIVLCCAAVVITVGSLAPGTAQAQTGQTFYALTPCRVVDTRVPIDPAAVKRGNFADDETARGCRPPPPPGRSTSSTARSAWRRI
jgi:hypothetical protein